MPSFVELVEKFLIIFQDALSGLNDSEKEEMAVSLIPEVCIPSLAFYLIVQQICASLSLILSFSQVQKMCSNNNDGRF